MTNLQPQLFLPTPADYARLVELHNVIWNNEPRDPADWLRYEASLPEKIRQQRWVVEADGRFLAAAGYTQNPYVYQPHKFAIGVSVRPEARRQGVGGALYTHVMAALAPLEPIAVEAVVLETDADSAAFAARRSFVEQYRIRELKLDLATFDPARFASQPLDPALTVKTLRQLLAGDPDVHRQLYELDILGNADAPSLDPITLPPFERYVTALLDDPNLLLDGFFVAVDGHGRYVGRTNLERLPAQPGELEVGFTCVRREYRRRGLALALKLRGIEFARSAGYQALVTSSHSANTGMLALNERLGFVRQWGTIHLVKTIQS